MLIADYVAGKILIAVFMLVCAICDFKTKEIDIRIFGVAFVAAAFAYVWMFFEGVSIDWLCMGVGFGVGLLMLILAGITRGEIGAGDAVFFMITGLCMGGYRNILLLCAGMLGAAIYGLVVYLARFAGGGNVKNRYFALIPILAPLGMIILAFA